MNDKIRVFTGTPDGINGVEHMVNEWLASNPLVEIKNISTTAVHITSGIKVILVVHYSGIT